MLKENADQIVARLRGIEEKRHEIEEAKSRVQILISERDTMLAQLRACCPHTHIIGAEDGMVESCGDCDGRGGKHDARFCEDCGDYESACPFYFDGWYRLLGEARSVGDEEFSKIYEKHPYRKIL
jgi:hypothetical protein